ncbi:MAG TPA: preprotein translocase subunit YajC [Gammaproteobacteria bacterium]|nr:preprotein translocase subunit YajC [Gammaproteobacteria bacterium]
MSFFISDALAEGGAAAGQQADFTGLIFMIGLFIAFYFLLIRPQVKRAKEHKKLTESVAKGDEVVTGGGLLGKVVETNDSFVTLEIAEGVEVKIQRQSVASLVPKGTIKAN